MDDRPKPDLHPVMVDGEMHLVFPMMRLDDYLSEPRWLRWTMYLSAALIIDWGAQAYWLATGAIGADEEE